MKDKELIKLLLRFVSIEDVEDSEDGKYYIGDNEGYKHEEITKEQHDRLEKILEE